MMAESSRGRSKKDELINNELIIASSAAWEGQLRGFSLLVDSHQERLEKLANGSEIRDGNIVRLDSTPKERQVIN